MDNRPISIDAMKDKIEQFGSNIIWKRIEQIANYQDRTAYRQLFFLAGGSLEE